MTRIFDRLGWAVAGALAVALLGALGGIIYAGPLDPPNGVTLSEPTQEGLIFQPADCSGFPIVISQPGSYNLAQTIDASGCTLASGVIDVTSGGVTLDLGGFAIIGDNGVGIYGSGGADVRVRNGTVTGVDTGISFTSVARAEISDISVTNVTYRGISVGWHSNVHDCTVSQVANNDSAIELLGSFSIVRDCRISDARTGIGIQGDRNHVHDNWLSTREAGIFVDGGADSNIAASNTSNPDMCPSYIDNGTNSDFGPTTSTQLQTSPSGNVAWPC